MEPAEIQRWLIVFANYMEVGMVAVAGLWARRRILSIDEHLLNIRLNTTRPGGTLRGRREGD